MSEQTCGLLIPPHPWLKQSILWMLVTALLLFCHGVQGQQAYDEKDQLGYYCSNNRTLSSCRTYVVYRVRGQENLRQISDWFVSRADDIASASNISVGQQLNTNQTLLIPIDSGCNCVGGRSQYNVTYVIQVGNTFYLATIDTYEGLTSYQAVEVANPSLVPTNLQPGDPVILPIRCACPSTDQTSKGVQMLVTYPVSAIDTLATISRAWNISINDLMSANELTSNSGILENTTLLLPFRETPQLSSSQFSSPQQSPPPLSPAPSRPLPTPSVPSGNSSNTGLIVGAACGATALMAVLLFLIWLIFFRKRKWRRSFPWRRYNSVSHIAQTEGSDHGKLKGNDLKGDFLAGISDLVDTHQPILYSFKELQQATKNFSAAFLIEGSVYRGVLRDRAVAIKEMKRDMSQELKILCKVHHSNLIKLLGISVNQERVYLVYEFAKNGSLSDCLHKRPPSSKSSELSISSVYLTWNKRLQIALDVAAAVEYIHDYTKPSYVHKDVNSSNILLDENFRAKVANFGMAKLAAANLGGAPMLTKHIAGTRGYMAPEYLSHGEVTPKLDVYGFGVILLELLSGQEAIVRSTDELPGKESFLSATIGPILDSDQKVQMLRDWMDPVLQNDYSQDCALEVAVLARSCVDDDPLARPSMTDITYRISMLLPMSLEWKLMAIWKEGTSIDVAVGGR